MANQDNNDIDGQESAESLDDQQGNETGQEAGDAVVDATSDAGQSDDAQAEASEDPLAAAQAEVAQLKDQLLRAKADMDNIRRRGQRDVENAHKFGAEKLIGSLLPVLDSLEKAVEASESVEHEESRAMAEGIALSLKLAIDTLEKAGVAPVRPVGEPFDPNLHEAMAMVPSPDAEPNSVIDVLQTGYTLNGRIVRAARVVVSKAPD